MKADVPDPSCTKASIDRQLTEVRRMGVSQMELVNKFDNALSGVAGDDGQTGVAVNSANFLETGSFWDMRHCPAAYPADVHDKQPARRRPDPEPVHAARRAVRRDPAGVRRHPAAALPLYGAAPHCNNRGLTDLGDVHDPRDGQAAHDLRPRPHERRRPARPRSTWSSRCTTPASCPATPGRPRTPTRGSTSWAASSRPTPATAPASWRSGASTCSGPTRATTSASATART